MNKLITAVKQTAKSIKEKLIKNYAFNMTGLLIGFAFEAHITEGIGLMVGLAKLGIEHNNALAVFLAVIYGLILGGVGVKISGWIIKFKNNLKESDAKFLDVLFKAFKE